MRATKREKLQMEMQQATIDFMKEYTRFLQTFNNLLAKVQPLIDKAIREQNSL